MVKYSYFEKEDYMNYVILVKYELFVGCFFCFVESLDVVYEYCVDASS